MAEITVNTRSVDMVSTGVMRMLDSMMTQNLVKDKDLRKVIRDVEVNVKKTVQNALKASINSRSGKLYTRTKSAHIHYRHVESAVKMSIYQKILGANVSLLSQRRRSSLAGESNAHAPIQGRYNPRRSRSQRTIAMQSYTGKWADMIVRWIDLGTSDRKTGFRQHYYQGLRNGEHRQRTYLGNNKFRNDVSHSTGRIPMYNFFSVSKPAQANAANILSERINKILEDINREYNNQ